MARNCTRLSWLVDTVRKFKECSVVCPGVPMSGTMCLMFTKGGA